MKFLKSFGKIVAAVGLVSAALLSSAEASCKKVKGHITSDLVAVFSNGEACTSPIALCTEGRFTGRLKGRFTFVADTLVPYTDQDPAAPPDVAATTGTVRLWTKFCHGTLVFSDTSSFSLSPDGLFGGLETVDGINSTGGCFGASGRIVTGGVFMEGCVDCAYEGEICRLGDDDEDNEDDEDDEDD